MPSRHCQLCPLSPPAHQGPSTPTWQVAALQGLCSQGPLCFLISSSCCHPPQQFTRPSPWWRMSHCSRASPVGARHLHALIRKVNYLPTGGLIKSLQRTPRRSALNSCCPRASLTPTEDPGWGSLHIPESPIYHSTKKIQPQTCGRRSSSLGRDFTKPEA